MSMYPRKKNKFPRKKKIHPWNDVVGPCRRVFLTRSPVFHAQCDVMPGAAMTGFCCR